MIANRACARVFTSRPSQAFVPASAGRKTVVRTNALLDFFKPKPKQQAQVVRPKRETVVLKPSFNLQAALLAIAGLEAWQGWYPVAAFTGLLGVFLTIQATRVSFIFDDEAFEIRRNGQETENVVVGGANRWPYESFINWELWFPVFPVLVYFKENQTKPEGQIHFFPIIFDGQQLYKVMVERCGPSATSGPKA